jgi:hypothetical protein
MIENNEQNKSLFEEQYNRLKSIVGREDNEFLLLTLELKRANEKNR